MDDWQTISLIHRVLTRWHCSGRRVACRLIDTPPLQTREEVFAYLSVARAAMLASSMSGDERERRTTRYRAATATDFQALAPLVAQLPKQNWQTN